MAADWMTQLVKKGLISKDQAQEAKDLASAQGIKIEDAFLKLEYVTIDDIGQAQAAQFGYKYVNLEDTEISQAAVQMLPESVARENTVCPVAVEDDKLTVAISEAMNYDVLDKLRFVLNREIGVVLASKESILAAINKNYGAGGDTESVDSILNEFTETAIDFTATEAEMASTASNQDDETAPVIRLCNLIIAEAVNMRASDIHVEPFENRVRIRYRIDGVLIERDSPPRRLLAALTSRFKIMSGIDISEKRKPQDGRIKTTVGGKDLDLRVSLLPSVHGQSIVMRILSRDNIKVGIRSLGFGEDNYRKFQNIIRRPNGIFLVTGPTGSGKTTTLYSALGELNRPDRKIITAEDPVEYYLPGINQVQVRASIGLTFARIVRAMLRQAPNVILVGEIRDHETAEMAIQASLTGHLVFSTLHTNDAPASITRLIDMGVQPFLVASSVMAIMAQRLVRRNCPKCQGPYKPDPGEMEALEIDPARQATGTFIRGVGCSHCQQTGCRGRMAVYELMLMNSTLREMTFRSEPAQNLRRQAKLAGMKTLMEDAVDKALQGLTNLQEIFKLYQGGH
ncbi:MAG: type secretory pathway, ATPase PulE/Tfp pilus assembly pathway, ATPase PilB [Planctomycetaceae bacterium]|nr:type secretory pathway, ATPase PulE/Tfp pilus assembly pathway, ATPase PilB [Planctomycetaceae bacterium]